MNYNLNQNFPNTNTQNNSVYLTYDQITPLNNFQNIQQLHMFIQGNFQDKDWKKHMTALNCLRSINKFYPQEVPKIVDQYQNQIGEILKDPKTILIKTCLIMFQEMFTVCKQQLSDQFIYAIVPELITKVFNTSKIIVKEAQSAFQLLCQNCFKDGLIMALCKETISKDHKISELSFNSLEFIVDNQGDNLRNLSENSFIYLFQALSQGLKESRKNNLSSSKKITRKLYQITGHQNFINFLNGLVQKQLIQNSDVQLFEKAFKSEDKSKFKQESNKFQALIKQRRQQMKQISQYQNQNHLGY